MYSCHIQKDLGPMRLRKITPELLQDCLNRISEKGLTAASVNSVRSMLSDLFTTACKHQIIRVNPMNLVHMPAGQLCSGSPPSARRSSPNSSAAPNPRVIGTYTVSPF